MPTFKKPRSIIQPVSYCAGCGHAIIQRLIAECIEELGLQDQVIECCDIACSEWSLDALDYDCIAGPHGRIASVATGVKKVRPNKTVYVHAGDGSSYVIGLTETSYAAVRDIPITMIVVNNARLGMTGGQMNLATTLLGDKTISSPRGRILETMGHPTDFLKAIAGYDVQFAARGALYDPKHIDETKRYIKKGFENQMANRGFSIIEILSPCPTNWNMDPVDSMEHIRTETVKVFPLGVFADRGGNENG